MVTRNIKIQGASDSQWVEKIEACPDGFDTGKEMLRHGDCEFFSYKGQFEKHDSHVFNITDLKSVMFIFFLQSVYVNVVVFQGGGGVVNFFLVINFV